MDVWKYEIYFESWPGYFTSEQSDAVNTRSGIIMNNHTCEIIDFISSAETFKNSLIIHEDKTKEIHF